MPKSFLYQRTERSKAEFYRNPPAMPMVKGFRFKHWFAITKNLLRAKTKCVAILHRTASIIVVLRSSSKKGVQLNTIDRQYGDVIVRPRVRANAVLCFMKKSKKSRATFSVTKSQVCSVSYSPYIRDYASENCLRSHRRM